MKRVLIWILAALMLSGICVCAEEGPSIDELRAMMLESGENWLFCNVGTSDAPEYRKLATLGEIEGYQFASMEPGIMDVNLHYCTYLPVLEEAPAQNVQIQMGLGGAKDLAENFAAQVASYVEVLYAGDVTEAEVNGFKLHTVVVEYRMKSYETEGAYDYIQSAVAYLETPIEGRCVALNAVNLTQEESSAQNRDAMCELLHMAAHGVCVK